MLPDMIVMHGIFSSNNINYDTEFFIQKDKRTTIPANTKRYKNILGMSTTFCGSSSEVLVTLCVSRDHIQPSQFNSSQCQVRSLAKKKNHVLK